MGQVLAHEVNEPTNNLNMCLCVAKEMQVYDFSLFLWSMPVLSYLEPLFSCDFQWTVSTQWKPGFKHAPCVQRRYQSLSVRGGSLRWNTSDFWQEAIGPTEKDFALKICYSATIRPYFWRGRTDTNKLVKSIAWFGLKFTISVAKWSVLFAVVYTPRCCRIRPR